MESDVSAMYFFADALSQYIFTRLVYTQISETKNKFKDILEGNRAQTGIDNDLIDLIKSEKFIEAIPTMKSISEINESSENENHTYEVDSFLLSYVEELKKHLAANDS
jgi:hypothetical protein